MNNMQNKKKNSMLSALSAAGRAIGYAFEAVHTSHTYRMMR